MMTPYGARWSHNCIKCGKLASFGSAGAMTAEGERRLIAKLKAQAEEALCKDCQGAVQPEESKSELGCVAKDKPREPMGPVLPAVSCSQCKKEIYSERELHELAPMYDRLLKYRENTGRLCKECNPDWGRVMTVAELMSRLSSLPPGAVVVVLGDTGPDADPDDEYKLCSPRTTLLTTIALDPDLLDADDSWYKQDGKSGLHGVIIM